jgi:MarR family transcriptional regulator, temperature-dependent positive regulator of motility
LLPKEEHRSAASSEVHYRLLKLLEAKPHLSQRALARELGISLGKINYCIAAVVGKGWVKAQNFRDNEKKLAYAYLLTPRGIDEKAALTANFLRRKMAEYDALKTEIAQLQRELRGNARGPT